MRNFPALANSVASSHYRADIDGLRAVAVLLVVAYHAKVPLVVNGFLGVDVFFVISGYVITRLLLRELSETRSISFTKFWRRRVIRLLPAFVLVLGAVLTIAPIAIERLSGEIGSMARAAMAALAINANHFFLFESADYFAAATETNALLHTWSLSVEEQFYLIWPALLLAMWRTVTPRVLLCLMLALSLVSFGVAAWLAPSHPAASFYLLPARAWQLLVGAVLALSEGMRADRDEVARFRFSSALGIALVIGAAFYPSANERGFSLALAALAVLGTSLVIYGSVESSRFSPSRFLAHPWLVYVGRISYPVYLWHWPLLVIARSRTMHESVPLVDAACVVASFLLGALTYEFWEMPWQRWASNESTKRVLLGGLGATFSLACVALLLGAWTRFGWGYSLQQQALDRARRDQSQVGCIFSGVNADFPNAEEMERCFPQENRASVLLWGDSHAQHWAPAIKALSERNNVTFASFSLGGCPPLPRREGKWRCDNFYRIVSKNLEEWRDRRGLRAVVLSARWANGTGAPPLSAGDQAMVGRFAFEEIGVTSEAEALPLFEASVRRQLADLERIRLRVLLILPSPNHRHNVPHCLAMRPADACHVTTDESGKYTGRVREILRRVALEFGNVLLLDPETLLCDGGRCPAIVDGVIAYSDDDHLSATWVSSVVPKLIPLFNELLSDGVKR